MHHYLLITHNGNTETHFEFLDIYDMFNYIKTIEVDSYEMLVYKFSELYDEYCYYEIDMVLE